MVRRRMVRGTVGGVGMLCDEWVVTLGGLVGCGGLLKLEMEVSEKLRRGGGCPYRDGVMQLNILRVENEARAEKCFMSKERRSGSTSMEHLCTAVKSHKSS